MNVMWGGIEYKKKKVQDFRLGAEEYWKRKRGQKKKNKSEEGKGGSLKGKIEMTKGQTPTCEWNATKDGNLT